MVPNSYNPPKISSLDVISRIFSSKFQQVHFILPTPVNLMPFIFKIFCLYIFQKYVNFTNFLNLIFGGFLLFGPTMLFYRATEGFHKNLQPSLMKTTENFNAFQLKYTIKSSGKPPVLIHFFRQIQMFAIDMR